MYVNCNNLKQTHDKYTKTLFSHGKFVHKAVVCLLLYGVDCLQTANTHDCDSNAVCNNTMGSFNCTCNSGYSGDGSACIGQYV